MNSKLIQFMHTDNQGQPGQDFIPIETLASFDPVPETSLKLGHGARVFEIAGEQYSISQHKGARLGCNHNVYSIREIGGVCPFCQQEAAILFNEKKITLEQADAHSLYCVSCFSHCQNCFTNLCLRHSTIVQNDIAMVLCPLCYRSFKKHRTIRLITKTTLLPLKIPLAILKRILT